MRVSPVLWLGLSGLAAGCLEVELTAPSVCLNAERVDLSIGPVPALLEGPMVVEEQVEPDAMELPEGLSGELVVLGGALAASEGTLAFVRRARVHVEREDTGVEDLLVYDREVDGVAGKRLPIRVSDEPVDVLAPLSDGTLSLGVEIEGDAADFPPELFVDARVCMQGQVRYIQRWVGVGE